MILILKLFNMDLNYALKHFNFLPNETTLTNILKHPQLVEEVYNIKSLLWQNPTTIQEYKEQVKTLDAYNTIMQYINLQKQNDIILNDHDQSQINTKEDEKQKSITLSYHATNVDASITPDEIMKICVQDAFKKINQTSNNIQSIIPKQTTNKANEHIYYMQFF